MNKTYLLLAVVGGLFILSRMPRAVETKKGGGWRYYSDGSAIDPEDNYYQDGALVFRASNLQ